MIKSVSVALRFIRSSRGLGHFPKQAKMRRVYTGALLANLRKNERKDFIIDAKLLYAIFFDRVSLSIKNGWVDENGRVFIYYSVINICEILNCGTQKACKLLDELEIFGGLERRRQGLGKPNKLYLKKVFSKIST